MAKMNKSIQSYFSESSKRREIVRTWKAKIAKMPAPESDAELEVLSAWYFGKPLRLKKLNLYGTSGSYEVLEDYNSYHGNGYQFSEGCCEGYDHSGFFWAHVCGVLYYGGIARASHGLFNFKGHRNIARLMRWKDSRARGQSTSLRPFFVRLAREVGAGENRVIRGDSVLIAGREDGAAGASL